MPFSSAAFILVFFPVVLAVYYLLSFSARLRTSWLFAASIVFYAWGQGVYAVLLLFYIMFNWIWGLLIAKCPRRGKASGILLGIACFVNLGPIIVSRCLAFAPEVSNRLALIFGKWGLPVGITFFSLQSLAYCIDIYRGDTAAEKNPVYVGLAISFFPKIIGGPIDDYGRLSVEMRRHSHSVQKLSDGACRFAVGLAKKALLADQFAPLADYVFTWSAMGRFEVEMPVATAWFGLIAFTLQIYFELSSCADMAVGMGKMFGFDLPENFRYPYASSSVSDFWGRWNITLLRWFRNYAYSPLDRLNSANSDVTIRNLLLVWLAIGFWHGGGTSMLLFSGWFFVLLLAEHFAGFRQYAERFPVLSRVYTLFAVMMGWVLLQTESLYHAGIYFMNLFGINYNSFVNDSSYALFKENGLLFLAGFLACTPAARNIGERMRSRAVFRAVYNGVYVLCLCAVFLLSLIYILHGGYNDYFYFR